MATLCLPGLDGKPICITDKPPTANAATITTDAQPRLPAAGPGLATSVVLAPTIREHDWGEQIVGSAHVFELPRPISVTGEVPTQIVAQVDRGRGAFASTYVRGTPGLPPVNDSPHGYADPIQVRFRPEETGSFVGELVVWSRWPSGQLNSYRVKLRGTARQLDEPPGYGTRRKSAPSDQDGAEPVPAAPRAKWSGRPVDEADRSEFNRLERFASRRSAALGSALELGVVAIKDEAATYRARPASRSIWEDLAEQAVSIGIGAVAGVIGGLLAKRLGALVARNLEMAHAPRAGTGLHPPSPALEPAPSPASAEGESPAAESAGESALIKQVGSAFTQALKQAGNSTIGAAIEEQRKDTARSTQPQVNFFMSQSAGLLAFSMESGDLASNRASAIEPLLSTNPSLAIESITEFGQSIDAAVRTATAEQAHATGQAWATFKARDTLGAEIVDTSAGPKEVTAMAFAREGTHPGLAPAITPISGLLEIHVALAGDQIAVTGARINGLAQATADRLLGAHLSSAMLPLRLVVNGGQAFITRDEAGRVRMTGPTWMFGAAAMASEAQAQRGAQRVMDQVLQRSLNDWAVTSVQTDDTPGKKKEGA